MSESSAALSYDTLMQVLAERAGYGFRADQSAGLTADEETELLIYLDEGYRTFLMEAEWSFLTPVTTSTLWASTTSTTTMTVSGGSNTVITASAATFFPTMIGHSIVSTNASYVIDSYTSATVVGVATDASADTGLAFQVVADGSYRLPDDFGGLISGVMFTAGDGRWLPLGQIGMAEIMELQQVSTSTGRPTVCAIESLAIAGTIGQRSDMQVWRLVDSDYTIRYQFQVLPDKLVTTKFPYGGLQHSETIKFACLAAMELGKFSVADGPHERKYQKNLANSIRRDKRGNRANSLGFLVDAQSRNGRRRSIAPYARTITSAGVSYP